MLQTLGLSCSPALSAPTTTNLSPPVLANMVREPETHPKLPYDVLHNIYTHCDIFTKQRLELRTNKAIFGHLHCTPTELSDLHNLKIWPLDEKLFHRAIITKDNNVFVQQMAKVGHLTRVRKLGLKLAIRYGNRHASWVFLAYSKVEGYEKKELADSARCQQDPDDLANITEISKFTSDERFRFFQPLLRNDIARCDTTTDGISQAALSFGLQLAGKCGYRQTAMALLSCDKLNTNVDPDLKVIIAAAEKRLTPTESADLAKIRNSQKKERLFFQSIIDQDKNMQNKQLHQLSKATQLYGLYLAAQYGSTWDSWLLLAWGELDAEENKELVENAKGRMTQTELADIARIHKSNAKDKQFFQAIISENTSAVKKYRYPYENHEVFKFGLQLAVRRGSIDIGRLLYASTEGSNEESEIYQIGEQAA